MIEEVNTNPQEDEVNTNLEPEEVNTNPQPDEIIDNPALERIKPSVMFPKSSEIKYAPVDKVLEHNRYSNYTAVSFGVAIFFWTLFLDFEFKAYTDAGLGRLWVFLLAICLVTSGICIHFFSKKDDLLKWLEDDNNFTRSEELYSMPSTRETEA